MNTSAVTETRTSAQRMREYTLLDALTERRSRRFGKGFHLNGGPLAYRSEEAPKPLSLEDEAALAFAACGITGFALADVPFQTGDVPDASGGNMWAGFLGRTAPSPDAVHAIAVFVINDDGAWLLKRPEDFERNEIAGLARAARRGDLVELYERSRVRIADHRVGVTREFPFILPLNKWSANVPGTTYFLPVGEYSTFAINVLLTAFDKEWAACSIDERNKFRPAGLQKHIRSRGGHLRDDPRDGRTFPLGFIETVLYELVAVETGAIIQNLALMTQALGLGGFPHDASHPFAWFQALGFRMEDIPTSRVAALNPLMRFALRAMKRDLPIPTAIGLEVDGDVLLKPWCPPYYRSMEEAVLAFVDHKFAAGSGTLASEGEATAWKNGADVQAGIPRPSDEAIAATIDFCEYVYRRYGRFPSANGPFRTTVAFQAHALDLSFYDRFYKSEAISDTQRERAVSG